MQNNMKGKIFTAQEVQAILAGNKTQFREVIKPQPEFRNNYFYINNTGFSEKLFITECPYKAGQEIFVKESFGIFGNQIAYKEGFREEIAEKYFWESAKSMKQEHSRITLRIKEIKVERLGDIGREDACKEGFDTNRSYYFDDPNGKTATQKFIANWNATHKKPEHKFEANPWVWVIGFEVVNKEGYET